MRDAISMLIIALFFALSFALLRVAAASQR